MTVMKWINDGRPTLSADRTVRIRSAMHAEDVDRSRDLAEDDWVVGLGDDVAVKFTTKRRGVYKGFIGRIVRMRRKRRKWVNYTRPVTIHGDRTDLEGLWFRLHWYKRVPSAESGSELRYRFTDYDFELVEAASLICPVTMKWHADGDYYVLNRDHYAVIRASEGGAESWEG